MSQNVKLMPNLDQQSTRLLNLTVLQRIDPFVEEILITAPHVTFYEFSIELNQWSRKDVEGTLFVVKRNTQPRFQFIVMNRRSTDNLVEDLLGNFEYDVQVPYLLYRTAAQEVIGIWFYNSQDCEAVAKLFSRILNAFSKVAPKAKASSAKSEFEELEAVPSLDVIEGPLEPPTSSSATSFDVPDGPLEPPTSSSATSFDVPDGSFVNFFSAAMNIGNVQNATIAGSPLQSSSPIPLASHIPSSIPSTLPTLQTAPSLPTSSNPLMPILDTLESSNSGCATNLVKPYFFSPLSLTSSLMMPPITASVPTAPPLHPHVAMQRPYGTPLLQPFPPPTPPSLTPAPSGPIITKEKVRDALLTLVQNSQFIDMVYRELLNAHNSL